MSQFRAARNVWHRRPSDESGKKSQSPESGPKPGIFAALETESPDSAWKWGEMSGMPVAAGAEAALSAPNAPEPETLIRKILLAHNEIPDAVGTSRITYLEFRLLTSALLFEICTQHPLPGLEDEWSKRLQRRKAALQSYVGRELLCAVVPQPGALYTVEIEPVDCEVVHWEWYSVSVPG